MMTAPPEARAFELPPPDGDALEHSGRVIAFVRAEIERAGGWTAFADYMQAVLYAPGLGYYAAGARKFGASGDFVTAPELTPLFGQALASSLAPVVRSVADAEVIELGPGTGRLAADVLQALAARDSLPQRYCLLEVSPDLRERQRALLETEVPELMPRIAWLDRVPARWRGVVLANEVLDAVPPHVIVRSGSSWFERGVALATDGTLVLADRPLDSGSLRSLAQRRFPVSGDYASEINLAAEALVMSLARHCERGALYIVDYGYPASEYYHPERAQGTVMVHYRHRSLTDPLFHPGLADVTSHVDFSAIAHAGVAGGMSVAGYSTQAAFLVEAGIAAALARVGDPRSPGYIRAAAAIQTLVSPAEMGERFKVLAMVRELPAEIDGFTRHDQSHRL